MPLFAYHTDTVSREDFNFTNVAKNINGSNFIQDIPLYWIP
ncbi:hypothetical protein RRG54_02255 [Mycoplasmopsis felis]